MNIARVRFVVAVMAVIAVGVLVAVAQSQKDSGGDAMQVQHVSPSDVEFAEVLRGVSKHSLWGDPETGPYGAYTRFMPGHVNPRHTHSSDIRIVVLEGAYIFEADGGEKRVGAHEYLFIPGGTPHVSKSDAAEGCLFYEESPGKFDLNVIE